MFFSVFLQWFFFLKCLSQSNAYYEAFGQQDEPAYLDAFPTLIKDSYSAPIPQDLRNQCQNQNQATISSITVVPISMTSLEL